jgi:hypothetical protein
VKTFGDDFRLVGIGVSPKARMFATAPSSQVRSHFKTNIAVASRWRRGPGNYQLRYVVARDGSADQNFIEQVSGTPPVSGSPAICCESALNDIGKVPYGALLGHVLKTCPVKHILAVIAQSVLELP